MISDFGRVLEFSNSKQAQLTGQYTELKEYAPSDESAIAATALRLLAFTCQVGWTAVSELLLAVVPSAEQSANYIIAELDRLTDRGLTLLHHAVCSRSPGLVRHTGLSIY